LDALLRVTPHAPAEVERTREELENAIQAAHEEPNLERLYQLGQKIGECIKAYGAACRQQGREEQAIGAHETCHDVVCNGNRSKPVGAKGSGCSCEGREVRMLQRLAEKDQEIARLSGELKLTHAHYGTDLKDAQEEIARLESRLAALSETLTELGNRVRAGVEAAPWVVAELEQALAELRKVNQSMRDRVL
jgi:tetratricopeptide (TPR) repeat protein